jgi:hypothetical protein
MELDDLKQQWNATGNKHTLQNKNIMELIQHKSHGPVAALKQSFRKQMIAMTVVPVAILATNMHQLDKTLSSALFWFYILFCICVVAFAKMNYGIVQKMEKMDGRVKHTLEAHVALLETRLKQNLIGIRVALLFFVLLMEVLPYIQQFKMLNTWHSLSPFIRFGAYAALFLLQYFISKTVFNRKFGQHLNRLKELVQQMQ